MCAGVLLKNEHIFVYSVLMLYIFLRKFKYWYIY